MRKLTFCLLLIFILTTVGCGSEPLKLRNVLEADQYVRNNIGSMSWNQFQLLLSDKNDVDQKDFDSIKAILTQKYSSSHMIVKNKIYRFNNKQELMYMFEWDNNENLGLKTIHIIEE